jgi:hypothetical protein
MSPKSASFFVQKFSNLFFWSHQMKIWEYQFLLHANIPSFWFFALIYTLKNIFCNELRLGSNRLKPSLFKNEKNYFTQICQIVKLSWTPNLIYLFISCKKYIFYDVPKFRLSPIFLKIFDVEIVWNLIKLIEFNSRDRFLRLLIDKNKKIFYLNFDAFNRNSPVL